MIPICFMEKTGLKVPVFAVVVKIRGRDVKVVADAKQPGAEARRSEGARVLRSIFGAANDVKDRDANRK